jgi:RNA polymerase sigma-70 factor (ECF subfamily)
MTHEEFGRRYDQHIKEIYDFCFYRVGHKATAEDLASEVFFKALRALDRFDERNPAAFRGWLFTIARNLIRDHYRAQKPVVELQDVFASNSPSAERLADLGLDTVRLHAALQELDDTEREIIRLRVWDDLPHAEIAALLDMSEGAVKVRFGRTLKKLATLLATFLLLLTSTHLSPPL